MSESSVKKCHMRNSINMLLPFVPQGNCWMARLISLNHTTALVSSSSCNKSWTPRSVDTWKTPLRLDLTAAHSIVAPFKSTHNSGLLVPVDDPAAVLDVFALHWRVNGNWIRIIMYVKKHNLIYYEDSLKRKRNKSVRTTQEEVQFLRIFLPFSVSLVLCRKPCCRTR